MLERTQTDMEFFAQRVVLDEITGCWNWTGSMGPKGYGHAKMKSPKRFAQAHIMAYLLFVGPVPKGKELHHKCRNRRCANPWHLEPKTHQEHCQLDFARSHCPKGHELVEGSYYATTIASGYVSKACKQCAKARAAARFLNKHKACKTKMAAYYAANRDRLRKAMKARYHRVKAAAAETAAAV